VELRIRKESLYNKRPHKVADVTFPDAPLRRHDGRMFKDER